MMVKIPLDGKKEFFEQVYATVRQIPAGRVTSYGAVAAFIGAPQRARMVGWALSQSGTQAEYVPAHRVVNRAGVLSGKHSFLGSNIMQELLENEGIVVENNKIVDFAKVFWNPLKNIPL